MQSGQTLQTLDLNKLSTSQALRRLCWFDKDNKAERLKKILIPTAIEGALLFSFAGAITPFINEDTAWYNYPFLPAAILTLLNGCVRLIDFDFFENATAFLLKEEHEDLITEITEQFLKNEPLSKLQFMLNSIFSYLRKYEYHLPLKKYIGHYTTSLFYALADTNTRDILIHESGHALAMRGLFKNANPVIKINAEFLFSQGVTSYNLKPENTPILSSDGKRIGLQNSFSVVSAAGTMSAMAFNYLSLVVAEFLPDNLHEVKMHLRISAAFSIINNLYYSLTGYGDCNDSGNDFCDLKKDGIPPYSAALLIILTPLILQCVLSGGSKLIHYLNRLLFGDKDKVYIELDEDNTETKITKDDDTDFDKRPAYNV